MQPRDDELRAQWLALCADPARDDLAAALAAAFVRELDAALAALAAATADEARATAIGDALRAALGSQLTRARALFRPGPYALELRRRLAGVPLDEGGDDDLDEGPAPDSDPRDPFLPWTLGDRACEAADDARPALLDASIAAFDAIALRPIDPGNDLGPFTRIAHLLDEPQVRRALAVTDRMAGADWGVELDHARAYLLARLAELGAIAEAEALLPTIARRSIRAWARGHVLGSRVACGRAWGLPAVAELPGDELRALITGLTEALPAAPEPLVLGCLDLARAAPDAREREATLELLVARWAGIAPLAAWSAAWRIVDDAGVRIGLLLELAAARLGDPGAPGLVRAALDLLTGDSSIDPGRWIDELVAVRELVPRGDAVAVFSAWMARAAHDPRAHLLRDIHYTRAFEELLRWLAGDAAIAAADRALAELTARLGDVVADG